MLHDISFAAAAGELLFLTGKTGAGKTSLLRLINGELRVNSGAVWAAGLPVHQGGRQAWTVRKHVGVVFQDYGLISSMTAAENVEFAYRISHVWDTGREARERAAEVLTTVGLRHRVRAFPAQLSGGERQRVAIARAVVSRPPILLADEPTGNLDVATSLEILTLLEECAEAGALVIVATHDPTLLRVGRRRLTLRDGSLVEQETIGVRAS